MAVTSGFFDSVNGDRKYNAEQFGSIFEGVIKDGVYKDVGDTFSVTAASGNEVRVGTGRGWFRNTWIKNDTPLTLPLSPPDPVLPRYDYIAIRNDKSAGVRANSIISLKGAPSTNPQAPTLSNTTNVKDYPIARVYRPGGAASITSSNISSLIGSTQTPWVTSVLENISVSNLYAGWEAEFDAWRTEQMDEFVSWMSSIEAVLAEEVAGNLAAEIVQLKAKTAYDIFEDIPEMHSQIFRGKNLGSSYTPEQKAAVLDGSFKDLWLGDYWKIGSVTFRIVDFNYFMGTGVNSVTTDNHVVVVPDASIGDIAYHNTATTNSYLDADVRSNLAPHLASIVSVFSDASVLSIEHNLLREITADGHILTRRTSSKLELMTLEHIYEKPVAGSLNATQRTKQFSLFRVAPRFIIADRDYYVQNLTEDLNTHYVSNDGAVYTSLAWVSYGLRPFFALRG